MASYFHLWKFSYKLSRHEISINWLKTTVNTIKILQKKFQGCTSVRKLSGKIWTWSVLTASYVQIFNFLSELPRHEISNKLILSTSYTIKILQKKFQSCRSIPKFSGKIWTWSVLTASYVQLWNFLTELPRHDISNGLFKSTSDTIFFLQKKFQSCISFRKFSRKIYTWSVLMASHGQLLKFLTKLPRHKTSKGLI